MKENRTVEDSGNLFEPPGKTWGRRALLGDNLDQRVQLYLKKGREGGGVVSARIAVVAARGILLTCDRSMLVEFGRHTEFNGHWAYSLPHRMNFVQRKVTTAKKQACHCRLWPIKGRIFGGWSNHGEDGRNPPELILNWDHQDGSKQHLDDGSARC